MGDKEFSSADPWGIPVEEVTLEPSEETAAEAASEPAADDTVAVSDQPVADEEHPTTEADAEAEEPEEPEEEEEEEEEEQEEPLEKAAGQESAEAHLREEPSAATGEPEPAATSEEWEPAEAPESKARGFSAMLSAALSSIRKDEVEEEAPTSEEPTVPAPTADILEETPSWMIEEVSPGADEETVLEASEVGVPTIEAEEPTTEAEEPTTEAEEPTTEAEEVTSIGDSDDADLEELVAALEVTAEVESVQDEDAIELPDTHPEVFSELEELSSEAEEMPPAIEESAAAEDETAQEAVPDETAPTVEDESAQEALEDESAQEPLEDESPQEPLEDESPQEPIEDETAQEAVPDETAPMVETAPEERVVAASPGVEWGSRWQETAQGWVESDDGRSTWRPIVATSDSVAQWDVDTYLGVVAGDSTVEAAGDPEARVAQARTVALQRMLDDAVARGAHAVVGAGVAVHVVGPSLVATATGTAVTLQARD